MLEKRKLLLWTILVIALSLVASHFESRQTRPSATRLSKDESIEKLSRVFNYIDNLYVEEIDWDKTIQGAIEGALETLDPHSVYIDLEDAQTNAESFEGKYQGIGIQFDVIEGYITVISVIPGSPAEEVGLMAGDKISRINGESAINLTTSQVPHKLKGPEGSKVEVTVLRSGMDEPFDITIVRDEIPIFTINTYFKTDDKTGYVWINRFASTTADELEKALQDLERQGIEQLILDLRMNGGGYLRQAVEVAGKFLEGHKKVVYTKGRLKRFDEAFYSDDYGTSQPRDYPMIVLIDGGTASASEIVAGAIQDYDRGLIVGTNSFGKGLVQNEFELNDHSRLRLTISRYYTPSGRLIQRPYKDKEREEYYHDAYADTIPAEHVNRDSLLREHQVYYTSSGREVYGGGGITPDVNVKWESYSRSPRMTQAFLQKRIFFETAAKWAAEHPGWHDRFDEFFASFEVSNGLLQSLKNMARANDITFTREEFNRDLPYLKNRLKAEIARSIWGMEKFYRVILQHDNQFQEARRLFPRARQILARGQSL